MSWHSISIASGEQLSAVFVNDVGTQYRRGSSPSGPVLAKNSRHDLAFVVTMDALAPSDKALERDPDTPAA